MDNDMTTMTEASWRESYNAAQQIPMPDLERIASDTVKRLVIGHSDAIGCPPEYLFVPLLTCCAGLMSNRTKIRVNEVWSEPAVLWSVVAAQNGSRKTMALKLLTEAIIKAQGTVETKHQADNATSVKSNQFRGRLLSGMCSVDELKDTIATNGGRSLCLVENMERHHKLLDLSEKGEGTLGDFYDSMPLIIFNGGSLTLTENSAFNHSGMAPPDYIARLMNRLPEWLSGKYVVSCPPMLDCTKINRVTLCLPDDIPSFGTIFECVLNFHTDPREYSFSPEAVKILNSYITDEWSSVLSLFDECDTRRGAVDKSIGQVVRLSGIILALKNACCHTLRMCKEQPRPRDSCLVTNSEYSKFRWNLHIDTDTIQKAIELNRYFLEQKLVLLSNSSPNASLTIMRPVYHTNNCDDDLVPVDSPNTRHFCGTDKPSSLEVVETYHSINNDNDRQSITSVCGQTANTSGKLIQASNSSVIHQQSDSEPKYKRPRVEDLDLGINTYSPRSADRQKSNLRGYNGEHKNDRTHEKEDWESGIPESDRIDVSTAVDFVGMDKQSFVMSHGKRIKRLLECYDDGSGVSATVSAQKSIAPPVRLPTSSNRHPVWASILFFKKVAELDIGTAEQTKHPTNRKFFWRFKRKRMEKLTAKNLQLLKYLFVDMTVYSNIGKSPKAGFSQELPPILDDCDSTNGDTDHAISFKTELMS